METILADIEENKIDSQEKYIDSRDINTRIDDLKLAIISHDGTIPTSECCDENHPFINQIDELESLIALRDDASMSESCWKHGQTLINEAVWEEYVETHIQDTFGISDDVVQILNVDWKSVAENVASDYRKVKFEGTTFYTRIQ